MPEQQDVLKQKKIPEQKSGIKQHMVTYGIPLACVGLLWGILALAGDFTFVSNDDCQLEAILSGAYSGAPEAHDVYHMYPLALIFAILYRILPGIPWYGLFLCVAQFGALYFCLVRCAGKQKDWCRVTGCSVLGCLFFAGLFLQHLVLIQYTLTAAILAAASLFLLVTREQESGSPGQFLKHRIPELGLYVLAFALRRQVGLLFLPFMAGACLYQWLWGGESGGVEDAQSADVGRSTGSSRRLFRRMVLYLVFGAVLLGCLAVVWGVDRVAYSGAEWTRYNDFNASRTNVYDFGRIPSYAEESSFYQGLGISAEEQMLLEMDDFTLSDRFDAETMAEVDACQSKYFDYRYTKEFLKKVLLLVRNQMTTDLELPFGMVVIALYLFAALGFILDRKYTGIPGLGYFVAVHVVCWGYLIWQNRLPERVTHGLYLAEIITLTAICVRVWKRRKGVLLAFLGILAGFSLIFSVKSLQSQSARVKENVEAWAAVKEYCRAEQEQLFVLDTVSFAGFAEPLFEREEGTLNYVLGGGWAVNTPTYYDKLKAFGLPGTLSEAIRFGKEVRLIVSADRDVEEFGLPRATDAWRRELVEQFTAGGRTYRVYVLQGNRH